MNGKDFKSAMKNPKNIYILVSTDAAMVDLYVSRFKEAINAETVSYGKIRPYGKLFKKITLNVLYMPKIDERIFDRKEYIFIYTDAIDKRSSVYKKHSDQIIELKNDYLNYVMTHSNMTEDEAKQLIKRCVNDLGLIKSELTVYNASDSCYNGSIDYSNDIYGWVDAFFKKEPLPRCTESPISIMALLSTNCSNLLNVMDYKTKGMNPYIVSCCKRLLPYVTKQEVVQIIGDCFYLDSQIKKGLIDVDYVLDYLIVRRYNDAIAD